MIALHQETEPKKNAQLREPSWWVYTRVQGQESLDPKSSHCGFESKVQFINIY